MGLQRRVVRCLSQVNVEPRHKGYFCNVATGNKSIAAIDEPRRSILIGVLHLYECPRKRAAVGRISEAIVAFGRSMEEGTRDTLKAGETLTRQRN